MKALGMDMINRPMVPGKALTPKQQVDYLCCYLLFPVFDMQDLV